MTAALAGVGAALGVQASRAGLSFGVASAQAQTDADDVTRARQVEVVDASGRRAIIIGTGGEGNPGVWFYDRNGKVRLSFGLYGDNNASMVLNDEQERAVEIFRTTGTGDPVLVLKSEGSDRVIMGLKGRKADPAFVYFDAQGRKKALFGDY